MKNKIYCAIDSSDFNAALKLAREVAPVTGAIKLGLEFFNAFGKEGVCALMKGLSMKKSGCNGEEDQEKNLIGDPTCSLFLDLKYHDIPNTVAGAIRAVTSGLPAECRPAYINVHCSGGEAMMRAAKEACPPETKLLGVTVLTSLDHAEMERVGYKGNTDESVLRLALLARECGLDGVVCSAREIALLKAECDSIFEFMVPGIRPKGAKYDDQKRTLTPAEALRDGATHLVIGRPITKAPDPAAAARQILTELSQ